MTNATLPDLNLFEQCDDILAKIRCELGREVLNITRLQSLLAEAKKLRDRCHSIAVEEGYLR